MSIALSVPFPGGCCLTCAMEFDPNIVVSHDSVETNITFSFANVYYGRWVLIVFNIIIILVLSGSVYTLLSGHSFGFKLTYSVTLREKENNFVA